jgi:transketolase|tara:strand:- start:134 stop:958 length:825 start_codon:yes stop_codon:yes gene_type:complete
MSNTSQINELKKISFFLRKKIIEISYQAKAHHIGSELSCIDILVALYFNIMNINANTPHDKNRDFFILSKGHAALALYVTLMKKGFFSENYLKKEFLSDGGTLGGHPDKNNQLGIEISSGSLGHGLSIGAGIALANKKDNNPGKVFVLLGDGECNEGMVWEALLFASHQKLNNLMAIIDYNKLQGFGSTKDILNLDPLKEKLESFGWNTKEVNGHDINSIINTSKELFKEKNKPSLLIANTIKGKGINSMENKFESHYEVLDEKKYLNIIKNYQ